MSTVNQAIEILRNGGIVILPTDTAFALSCRVDDAKAVQRLFQIKNRSKEQAVPILVADIAMAEKYGEISDKVKKLLKEYWPGQLTVVVPRIESKISSLVLGMGNTIGLRAPHHETCLQIISRVGVPLVGTSANFHGNLTPYTSDMIDQDLVKKVDGVVEGVCEIRNISTIVDTTKIPWQIVRQGAVSLEL